MTNKRTTKNALFTSVIALLLCCSMLIGTTFAWFTDSVTSANNIIKSGNLDVELYYQLERETGWTKVTADTNVFMKDALWEPGHTEVVKLKVVNEGSLALKYQLGVNIASETGSVNAAGSNFLLSDYIKFGIIEGTDTYSREQAVAKAEEKGATALQTAFNSKETKLLPLTTENTDNEDIVTMVVYMPTTVGNEANHATGAAQPTINLGINLYATQVEAELDSFGNDYDKDAMTFVANADEAQAALDNAVSGTIIKLEPGVDYGTLIFRQNASSTVVDITNAGGDAVGNEKYRKIDDLTIIGADGAVLDGFDFEVGWIDGSGASFIDVKNLTVRDVTFSGEATPFNFEGAKGSTLGIDGLTIANCKMNDEDGNNRFIFQQISGYKELNDKTTGEYVMTTGIKDLTITNCEVTGAHMVIESRAMENLTITNNIFKGIKQRDILITSDTGNYPNDTYTGTITVTGNTSIGGEERFVRASLNNSDAVVVIKDNTIINYVGEDDDYIKVEGGKNVTIDNNPMTRNYVVSTVDEFKAALNAAKDGETITLTAEDFGGVDLVNTTNNGHRYSYANYETKNLTIDGQGIATFSGVRFGENDTSKIVMTGWTLKNINFTGNGLIFGINNEGVTVEGCTFTDTELQNTGSNANQATNFTVKNCSFTGGHATRKTQLAIQNNNGLTVTGCTFTDAAHNAMNITETKGAVTIENNTINGTADRPLRFAIANSAATLTIKNNTIVSNGDEDGQLMKADGNVNADNITFSGNTWNGKADSEVSAGMIGSDYIVK